MLRVGAPALAAIALVIVVAGESASVDHDLQLIVPRVASAGRSLPVRALVYTGLDAIEGPRLAPRDVTLELLDGDRTLARGHLRRSRAGTSDVEGELAIPQSARGKLRLRGTLRIGRDEVTVTTQLTVVQLARGELAEGRPLRLLQQFSESGIQRVPFGGPPPPSAFEVRVGGGACAPEQPCTLYVHVGEPASAIMLEPSASVTWNKRKPDAAPEETTGVVAFDIVTHGPEAEVWVRALRGTRAVGRRSVRLPIAQGSAALLLEAPRLGARDVAELTLVGDGEGCIVDAHRLGEGGRWQWTHTGSLEDCSVQSALPWGPLPPGIYRLQARRDAFATTTAGVRVVQVRADAESEVSGLAALAAAARVVDPYDKLAAQVSANPGAFASSAAATFGYLASILEAGLVAQPRAATGYAEARAKLSGTRARLRWLAILALAIGGVSLALGVGKRGLSASLRASEILVDAGQDQATANKARMRATLATIGSVLALLLVFAVVALYLMVRGSSPL